MSVNLNNRQNVGILVALVVGTIAVIAGGLVWIDDYLIVEVSFVSLVLVVALVLYDKLLVM